LQYTPELHSTESHHIQKYAETTIRINHTVAMKNPQNWRFFIVALRGNRLLLSLFSKVWRISSTRLIACTAENQRKIF
jgi:hypothetical protein